MRPERLPCFEFGGPLALHLGDVQDREDGLVVLEALTLRGAPNRHEVVGRCNIGGSRNGQPEELAISTTPDLAEDEERRHELTLRRRRVDRLEDEAEQLVAPATHLVQRLARLAVVAVVGEQAGVHVEAIGPISLRSRGVEDRITELVRFPPTVDPEPALISGFEQLRERIIGGIAFRAALIDRVDDEVAVRQLLEGNVLGHRRSMSAAASRGVFA